MNESPQDLMKLNSYYSWVIDDKEGYTYIEYGRILPSLDLRRFEKGGSI